MFITTNALVVREVAYKESDKILTLLSKDRGKITVSARGCRKKDSKFSAACQILFWNQFVLQENKGRWYVKEVSIEHEFQALPLDFQRFSLACYFAELGEILSIEEVPQDDLLSLLLNCLHILNTRMDLSPAMIKTVLELRAVCQSGYEPMVDSCSFCGSINPLSPQLSLSHGTIHCKNCGGLGYSMAESTLSALRYIVQAPPNRIFSFEMDNIKPLAELAEAYLLTQLDCPFPVLEFYHKNTSDF